MPPWGPASAMTAKKHSGASNTVNPTQTRPQTNRSVLTLIPGIDQLVGTRRLSSSTQFWTKMAYAVLLVLGFAHEPIER